jgi:hypothetical protein
VQPSAAPTTFKKTGRWPSGRRSSFRSSEGELLYTDIGRALVASVHRFPTAASASASESPASDLFSSFHSSRLPTSLYRRRQPSLALYLSLDYPAIVSPPYIVYPPKHTPSHPHPHHPSRPVLRHPNVTSNHHASAIPHLPPQLHDETINPAPGLHPPSKCRRTGPSSPASSPPSAPSPRCKKPPVRPPQAQPLTRTAPPPPRKPLTPPHPPRRERSPRKRGPPPPALPPPPSRHPASSHPRGSTKLRTTGLPRPLRRRSPYPGRRHGVEGGRIARPRGSTR